MVREAASDGRREQALTEAGAVSLSEVEECRGGTVVGAEPAGEV